MILLVFASSASAADANATEVLSVDESASINNEKLALDYSSDNAVANDTNAVENKEILQNPNTDTLYVNESADPGGDGSETKPFNTLNDALNEAQDGNTIMIASGKYTGTDNTGLEIRKNLNFIKYGDDEAIFDAEKQSRIWTVTATSINITGLTFKNGKAGAGSAIYFANELSNFNINATFIGNTANSGGGAIHFEKQYEFTGNINGIFVNNTADTSGAAINVVRGSFAGNINGSFVNNKASYGGAVYIDQDFTGNLGGIFINNSGNSGGGAIELEHGTMSGNITGIFINNTANNGGAIYTDESDTDGLLIQDSIFINNNDNIAGSDMVSIIFLLLIVGLEIMLRITT